MRIYFLDPKGGLGIDFYETPKSRVEFSIEKIFSSIELIKTVSALLDFPIDFFPEQYMEYWTVLIGSFSCTDRHFWAIVSGQTVACYSLEVVWTDSSVFWFR